VDDALLGVLATALRKDPAARFQTMNAFHDALADPAAALARGAVTAGWHSASPHKSPSWNTPLDEPQSLKDWLRYIGVAVLVLLALAAIGAAAALLRPAH
jgi:hypothetical protein